MSLGKTSPNSFNNSSTPIEQERIEEKNKNDEKREKHERREKKEKSGDKKKISETIKKDENQEDRKIQSLFMREKKVKRVMLARQPMYLLIPHDYYLSSIASSLPIALEELLKEFGDVFPKDTSHGLLPLRGIEH